MLRKRFSEFIGKLVESYSAEEIFLRMVYFCGAAITLPIIAVHLVGETEVVPILLISAVFIASAVLLLLSRRGKVSAVGNGIVVTTLCGLLLPAIFLTIGGYDSGMASYFAFSIVMIFVFFPGKRLAPMLAADIFIIAAVHTFNYLNPEVVERLTPFRQYLDNLQSSVFVGIALGVFIHLQQKLYREEHKRLEKSTEETRRREELLRVNNEIATLLISSDTGMFELNLRESLEQLAAHLHVDRIYLCRNYTEDGALRFARTYVWERGAGLIYVTPQKNWNAKYADDFPVWGHILVAGRSVNGPMSDFTGVEREIFSRHGARSVLISPVYVHESFWGFVGFEDLSVERHFSGEEESIMHVCALLLANTYENNRSNMLLEEQVALRTSELLEQKELAEEATRIKSTFMATMSHEIRTPLNAIIGFTDILLQSEELPKSAFRGIEQVRASGSNLLFIINDILDISKIESGVFDLINVEYDMPNLVNDAVQLNIVRIGSKQIRFKLNIDNTIPRRLFGDEVRVRQVLNNILSNAIKYTREGSVELDIGWQSVGEKEVCVVYAVRDTGIGIKEEDIGKLFAAYSQFDQKANRRIEGTGLGLAITKHLLDMMGGDISVESEYGRGSVFTARMSQTVVDPTPIGEQVAEMLSSFRFMGDRRVGTNIVRAFMPYGRVLVVDDVETNLEVARGLLNPYGLTVDTVTSGEEAIRKIAEQDSAYDVVFMDHMMPEMDGIETVRRLRNEVESGQAKTVPIVALTANAISGQEEIFLGNGFNEYISKPIDIVRLNTVLQKYVKDKQTSETLLLAERMNEDAKGDAGLQNSRLASCRVDGVDFEAGLRNYGAERTYLQILRSFVKFTPELLERLRKPTRASLDDYAIAVHGLKSSGRGIAADALGARAEVLESAAKAGDLALLRRESPAFIIRTEALIEDISAVLEVFYAEKPKKAAEVVDRKLLGALYDAAGQYRTAKMEEIMTELESCDYAEGGELVEWLREQFEELEYDAIRDRLAEEFGIGGESVE